jgi:hypothetical protein
LLEFSYETFQNEVQTASESSRVVVERKGEEVEERRREGMACGA